MTTPANEIIAAMQQDEGASAEADRATHEPSPSGLGHSVGVPSAQIDAVIHLLANFPSNGNPQDREASTDALLLGFIERREVTKPCRECGTARFDYSFMKLTAAGKLFLEAASAMSASGQDAQRLEGEAPPARPVGDAQ